MSSRHLLPAGQLQKIRRRVSASYRTWASPLAAEFRTASEFAASRDIAVMPSLPSGPAMVARIQASQLPLGAFLDMAASLGGGVLYLGSAPDGRRGVAFVSAANGVTHVWHK